MWPRNTSFSSWKQMTFLLMGSTRSEWMSILLQWTPNHIKLLLKRGYKVKKHLNLKMPFQCFVFVGFCFISEPGLCSSGWHPTPYVAKDNPGLLIFLPPTTLGLEYEVCTTKHSLWQTGDGTSLIINTRHTLYPQPYFCASDSGKWPVVPSRWQ